MATIVSLAKNKFSVPVIVAALSLFGFVACGGGGGGGGSGSDSLEILDEAPYLLNDGGVDPRTGLLLQFILRGLSDPGDPLTEEDIEVRRDGQIDVEARVRVNPTDVAKSDIALVLDVSSSLDSEDLQKVKASAQKFATEMLDLTSTLRVYYFSSPSETRLLGEYKAVDNGLGVLVWNPDPIPDIGGIPGGADSTALFHSVRKAILEDPEKDDILVVFSDGKENSSPQGAREEALDLIEEEKIVVFSVGFGSVDRNELQEISDPYGEFLGVRPSLDGLFDEVGRKIQSVYAVVYDSPIAFGVHKLDFRIKVDRTKQRYVTEIDAGVDLAKASFGRFPSLPGSVVELNDFTQTPPAVLTYTVLPIEEGKAGVDGLYVFAIEPTFACPGVDCVPAYQGPYGEGARSDTGEIYLPAALVIGETWTDPLSEEEFTFVGFENVEVLRGTGNRRRYRCAKVTFTGGTHWFAQEIGLIRTKNTGGDIVLDLASPPCLSASFDGDCVVQ